MLSEVNDKSEESDVLRKWQAGSRKSFRGATLGSKGKDGAEGTHAQTLGWEWALQVQDTERGPRLGCMQSEGDMAFFFPLTNHGRLIRDFEMKHTCIYYRQTYIPSHLTVWRVKCWYLHFLEEGAGYQGADLQSSGPRQGRSTLPLRPNCRQQLDQGTRND